MSTFDSEFMDVAIGLNCEIFTQASLTIVSGAVWAGQPGRGPVCLGQAEGQRGELQHEHRQGQRQPPGVLHLH